MYKKTLYFAFIAFVICNIVDARKSRRNKRPKDEEDSTPQPNVVTYSTFGFNDVGAQDGFVPSSPDYANYLSRYNQEASTRLYAPAFPTALESSGFNNYGQQSQDPQSFPTGEDNVPQASMLQYPQSTMSFYNSPNLDIGETRNQNGPSEEMYTQNVGEVNAPIYGTKIGSRHRNKAMNPVNETEFNVYSSGPSHPTDIAYSTYHEVQPKYESKPTSFGEPGKKYHNPFNYPSSDNSFMKPSTTTQTSLKFPKVIDFTKYKQYYPSEIENTFSTSTVKPSTSYNPWPNANTENTYSNQFDDPRKKFPHPISGFNDAFKDKDVEEATENIPQKPTPTYTDIDYSQNSYFSNSNSKDATKDTKFNYDFKDKFKYKPFTSTNYTNDYKSWKNPLKGYQYFTDYSNTTFEFDFSGAKKPSNDNNDEIIPASSNVIDLTSYTFPESDYSNFKKAPSSRNPSGEAKYPYGDDFDSVFQSIKHQNKYDPEEYVRSLYSTVPTTTTLWGNVYKTSEYPSFKQHVKKPQFVDDITDDVVHIPKRPYSNKYNFGKYSEIKPSDWSSFANSRPYKSKKNKDVPNTRFKSEEDLLGLRTHDTSHPAYLPTYKPSSNSIYDDYDYKKLVEKWRQSYLKAKYKDSAIHDFESYPSETRPVHVPVPRPYPIEVPHPVIVPVPQPYPVRVPIPKPVAVPVVHELTVAIEKPVPYPVIKKVPYPIEKPVPVPVEKEVQVPVLRPYPVHIPHIRPVFHHSRPPRDEADSGIDVDEEDDYMPRPDSKRTPYAKRPKSTRSRPRRPSRPTYHHHDRNRRRWPSRRPTTFNPEHKPQQRNPSSDFRYPQRHREPDYEEENENSDYSLYCKRTGNC